MGFSETRWVVRGAVMGALAIAAILFVLTWYTRRKDNAAMKAALPACASRIGDAACEEHFDRHHRECFNITNDNGTRFRPPSFDSESYLECIVKTPEVWLKEREAERARKPH